LGAKRAILGSVYWEFRAQGSRVRRWNHPAAYIDNFVAQNVIMGVINTYFWKVILDIAL
jgi:hypothetical protein